jgi:glycogen(starch) synthase
MRIFFFTAHFPPYGSGGEIVAGRLVASLVERGHDLLVATSHGSRDLPDYEEWQGAAVHRFGLWDAVARPDPGAIAAGRRWLADLKRGFAPDVVHLNTISPVDLFHWQTLGAGRAPTVVTLHGMLDPRFCRPLRPDTVFDHALRRADGLVACSAAVLADVLEVLPSAAARCHLVYNGSPTPEGRLGALSATPPRLLCLGRLVPEKGVETALAAFARVRATLPAARLVVGGDGPERARLSRLAAELGVADAVDFAGAVAPARVPELLASSSLVLLPTLSEGFGLVALEAALHERPVVASRVGGLGEVVADGLTGLLVAPGDAAGMAAAAIALLTDEERCRRFGLTARRRAEALFGVDRQVDGVVEVYQALVLQARRVREAS